MGTGTASGEVSIVRWYSGEAPYSASYGTFGDHPGVAGDTEPMLTEPIVYGVELAERERTHDPLPAVEGDLTNTDFGI